MVAACYDKTRHDDGGRGFEKLFRHCSYIDPVELLHVILRPDLGAHQSKTHLNEPMVEMDQHHVVTALRDIMVEGDRPHHACMGMPQPFHAASP